MAAQRIDPEDRRIMGSVLSRGFTVGKAPLTATESIALECLKQIASEGRRATKAEICAAIGSDNHEGGTAPGVVNRLEQKGYITTTRFQRGFQVCIVETGQCTLPPRDQTPHWRVRTDRVPAPAIQSVRERSKPISAMIEAEARLLGKSLTDFLADLCVTKVRKGYPGRRGNAKVMFDFRKSAFVEACETLAEAA